MNPTSSPNSSHASLAHGAKKQERERNEHHGKGAIDARELIEKLRDKAVVAVQEQPYLVPVAACAVGVGIGVLLGSRLTRYLVFAAIGGLVSDTLGGEIKRLSHDFLEDLEHRFQGGHLEHDEAPPAKH